MSKDVPVDAVDAVGTVDAVDTDAVAAAPYESAEYFAHMYSATTEDSGPRQSRFDRARDRLMRRMVERHSPVPIEQARILDVGCGYGFLLDVFADAASTHGVDISHHAVEQALARSSHDVHVANVEHGLPFRGNLDVVLAINVIEHLSDPAAGIAHLRDALAPGGIVIAHLPTVTHWWTRRFYEWTYASDPTHIYRPHGREVRAMFEAAGMTLVRESYLPHTPAWLFSRVSLHPAWLGVFRLPQ